ncbi:MAG: NAD-dependent deacetylase [Bacteriovoracaceae bacterium]|jgi:NAD-dependent deacetylase
MENIQNIVILTGAGISAESGISTFRDANGLWENHSIEEVATPEGFNSNPPLVYEFYNQRRAQLKNREIKPNLAHLALARLEKEFKGSVLLVTQNVDDLHQRALSQNLIQMHGQLNKMRCQRTHLIYDSPLILDSSLICECCEEKGNLRPHIVWFGEMPLYMDEIQDALLRADLFISIGTSSLVYPAANFYEIAKHARAITVELNLEKTVATDGYDYSLQGKATELVPQLVDDLISGSFSPKVP